jgi:hypothetical protein
MPGVPSPPLIQEDDPQALFLLTQYLQELNRMSRSLTFLDSDGGVTGGRRSLNIDAVWVAYVSNSTANTEDTVAHNLGRTPVGLFVGLPDVSAVIYAGPTAWTSTNIFMRASAATVTVNLLVF